MANRLRRFAVIAAIMCMCAAGLMPVFAQGNFTSEQYKKALWMVTRMYGGQRSGYGPNWLLMGHTYETSFVKDKDPATGHDLVGGWFDCGDHVLFGQTFFFSAYMLARAYDAFPTAFDDLYNGTDYSDYAASGDWSINGGIPNGIPDLLEELKYATDWIIKAAPNTTTFYSQKGNGDVDHKNWVTAGYMSTLAKSEGGESDSPRDIVKNPQDGHMASFAAATLAVMSRRYRKYSETYADSCLDYAKNAYAYAKAHKNQSIGAGYYGSAKHPATSFFIAAAEMFLTTGGDTYKDDMNKDDIKDHGWVFCYENPHDLAPYVAALVFPSEKNTHLNFMKEKFVDKYNNNRNSESIISVGDDWGGLRYTANAAFATTLYASAADVTSFDDMIYKQVNYILGKNNAGQSFVVGFCEGCTKAAEKPHHRNVFLSDDIMVDKNSLTIPTKNKIFGYMVGGNRQSGSYIDEVDYYQATEGGIDYNAGLLGTLAYIVSTTAPVDTSKFGEVSSVRHKTAPSAKNGCAINVRPGAVVFKAADGGKITKLSVINLKGRAVFSKSGAYSEIKWDSATRPKGMYLVKMTMSNGAVVQRNLLLK